MPKYNFFYGDEQKKSGGFLLLGEVDYPYELQKGDVVIIGENFMNKIRKENFSNGDRQQYYVDSIHHWIDPVSTADVYLVKELK